MKKENWTWIERAVWIIGILATIFISYKSNAKKEAIIETQLETLIKNDEKRTEYWNRQNEINGRIIQYMRIDD